MDITLDLSVTDLPILQALYAELMLPLYYRY